MMPDLTPARLPCDAEIVALLKAALPDLRLVYRYGSAGGPHARADSDLDLAVWAGHRLDAAERLQLSARLARLCGMDVDLNDLRTMPVSLRVQIVLGGALLFAADATEAAAYATHTLSDYVRLNEARREILDDIGTRGKILG
ncbi:MAG: nucleotidyltransferase domain-containing protein [Thiobacillaceae bacterium]|nr:nucleotidyltransferase domain-containing protein [Thiobacillaceae bacterium]